jgi:hypothetical protein
MDEIPAEPEVTFALDGLWLEVRRLQRPARSSKEVPPARVAVETLPGLDGGAGSHQS